MLDRKERQLSAIFKALSDPTRRGILRSLAANGPQNVGELVAQFGWSQPSISRHLRVLNMADLVEPTRRGQRVFYALRRDGVAAGLGFLRGVDKPE